MTMQARKDRINDLVSRILDVTEDGIMKSEDFRKLNANFCLEHGLSRRTLDGYIKQLEQIDFLRWNYYDFVHSERYWKAEEGDLEKEDYWKVNESKTPNF